jgi:hypothetical protein
MLRVYLWDHLSKTSAQQTEGLTVPKAERDQLLVSQGNSPLS